LAYPKDSATTLTLGLPGTTLWYEVAVGDATSPIAAGVQAKPALSSLRLVGNGGHPALAWDATASGRIEVDLLDARGSRIRKVDQDIGAGSGELALSTRGFALARVRMVAGGVEMRKVFVLAGP
jgi:hypothetical protein